MGGDANRSDFPIMTVETDRDLLLRGAIKREYTGHIWVDTSVNSRRSISASPLRRSLRNRVLRALIRPDSTTPDSAPEGLIDTIDVSATFLSRGTERFLAHRTGLLT